jgi:hypothetical protein
MLSCSGPPSSVSCNGARGGICNPDSLHRTVRALIFFAPNFQIYRMDRIDPSAELSGRYAEPAYFAALVRVRIILQDERLNQRHHRDRRSERQRYTQGV